MWRRSLIVVGRVRREPAALDDVAERVPDVREVEVQADRGRGTHHAGAVEHDELALVEELEVFPVVPRLEAFLVGEGGEADELQGFELLGVFGPCVHDDEARVEAAGVPEHGRILTAGSRREQRRLRQP